MTLMWFQWNRKIIFIENAFTFAVKQVSNGRLLDNTHQHSTLLLTSHVLMKLFMINKPMRTLLSIKINDVDKRQKMQMYCFLKHMMTSSYGNIFRVTGPLCGEFIGHRRMPLTKASDAERLWSVS